MDMVNQRRGKFENAGAILYIVTTKFEVADVNVYRVRDFMGAKCILKMFGCHGTHGIHANKPSVNIKQEGLLVAALLASARTS